MKFDFTKEIIRNICLAQAYSDAAKHITNDLTMIFGIANDDKDFCYQKKDKFIYQAITMVNRFNPKNINYYVIRQPDQNGNMSNVIYFDIKIDEMRYQISFHNFRRAIRNMTGKGRVTRWHGYEGSSREAAEALSAIYKF